MLETLRVYGWPMCPNMSRNLNIEPLTRNKHKILKKKKKLNKIWHCQFYVWTRAQQGGVKAQLHCVSSKISADRIGVQVASALSVSDIQHHTAMSD